MIGMIAPVGISADGSEPGKARDPAMSNLKQLLIARNEWVDHRILAAIRRSENRRLTPAQSRLLAHMGGRPMSMAALARRLAISRQAVHKTVGELARLGILRLRDDPERGNSKLIEYTEVGREVNRRGARIIADIEKELAGRLGPARVKTLLEVLAMDWGPALDPEED